MSGGINSVGSVLTGKRQTMRENHSAYHKIWFRPRVLVDVEKVDFTTTMLGTKVDAPFYVTAVRRPPVAFVVVSLIRHRRRLENWATRKARSSSLGRRSNTTSSR